MNIILTQVFVDNQDKALNFYTSKLGFIKKKEIPLGDAKWLTVVSPNNQDGVELLLEPNWHPGISINGEPAARAYQKILFDAGIPAALFGVDNIEEEHKRLEDLGVVFKTKPINAGPVMIAVFDDTCGNLIQIIQRLG